MNALATAMNWLGTIDWGAVALASLALGFTALMLKAVARLRRGRDYGSEVESDDAKPTGSRGESTGHPKPQGRKGPKKPKKRRSTASVEASPQAAPAQEPSGHPAQAPHDVEREQQALARGLARTRGGFISRLGRLFGKGRALDDTLLEQVEEVLFTADIGVKTSQELIESLRVELGRRKETDAETVWSHLKARAAQMVAKAPTTPLDLSAAQPFVLLVVGVNGVGKTTTIGKLAAQFRQAGHRVILAAGDTFRAAASQQLEIWGERTQSPVVVGKEGADPASVIVEALKRARDENFDVIIADTAGRLHTKVSLMDEIDKVRRSVAKHQPGAPHETLLVLDATTGQNAIAQAQMFNQALDVTGIVLSKLDGTAKGGVLLGICNELCIPVRFIGIGEQVEDLRPFAAEAFVEALFATDEDGPPGDGN